MVDTPSDPPLGEADFTSAREHQLQTASWFRVGHHVHFPSQFWDCLDVHVLAVHVATVSELMLACIVLLYLGDTVSLESSTPLALAIFSPLFLNKPLSLEGRDLMEISH